MANGFRGGAMHWLELATEEEELREPALQMKSKGDTLIPGGTEKQLTKMAQLKRSELAEIEAALALLVKTRNRVKGKK